jgi:hypothetical protein
MYSSETEIMVIGSSLIEGHSFTQLHHTMHTLTLAGKMLINRYFIHKSSYKHNHRGLKFRVLFHFEFIAWRKQDFRD